MARTTFGPAGQKISVTDATLEVSDQEITESDFEPVNSDADIGAVTNSAIDDGPSQQGNTGEDASGSGQARFTDPSTAATPKRRGRRAGTKNRPKPDPDATSKAAFVTANLEKVLLNLNNLAAMMLRNPNWKITRDDAALLAEAIKEVCEAYDFTSIMNPKVQAWIDLSIALTMVYGERIWTSTVTPSKPAQPVVIQGLRPPYQQPISPMDAYRESREA